MLFPTSLTFEKHKTGDVACRQLGYERVAQIGRDALGLETPSSAPIILEWVNCTGTEPSLSKCKGEFYFRWLEKSVYPRVSRYFTQHNLMFNHLK